MKRLAAVLALAALTASGTASANFINAGFETGDFSGWTVGGTNGGTGVALDGTPVPAGSFQPAAVNVRSGNYAAFGATASFNSEYFSLSQNVFVAAGRQTVGFYMGHDDSSIIGIDPAISNGLLGIFINGVNTAFTQRTPGTNFSNGSGPGDMYLFATDFASLGEVMNFEFRISGSGTGRTVLSVDDLFITGNSQVPEPGALALLGIGLLGLIGVRRKVA